MDKSNLINYDRKCRFQVANQEWLNSEENEPAERMGGSINRNQSSTSGYQYSTPKNIPQKKISKDENKDSTLSVLMSPSSMNRPFTKEEVDQLKALKSKFKTKNNQSSSQVDKENTQ